MRVALRVEEIHPLDKLSPCYDRGLDGGPDIDFYVAHAGERKIHVESYSRGRIPQYDQDEMPRHSGKTKAQIVPGIHGTHPPNVVCGLGCFCIDP